jgi:glycine hydroxymethyltransferase
LADELMARGFDLVSGGTDNHLILIDLTPQGVAGKPVAKALDRAGLVANYNTVPYDPRKPFDPSGLRLGTPAVTSRGMGVAEMRQIGAWIDEVVAAVAKDDEDALSATTDRVEAQVRELTADFPAPGLPV